MADPAASCPTAGTFEFERIIFTVSKEGDEVTGSARFPYPGAGGRTEIAIDYRRAPVAAPLPTSSDPAMQRRLAAVQRFRTLRQEKPSASANLLCSNVAKDMGVSQSAVRVWVQNYNIEGAEGLRDNNGKVRSIVHLEPANARDAVIVCAWWSFRIGGIDEINGPMINQVAGVLRKMDLATVIAAIDCCYSYPTDRKKFPFQRFSMWLRYEVEKWMLRAARSNPIEGKQYTNELPPSAHPVAPPGAKKISLQTTEKVIPPTVPDPGTRRREANWSARRRAAYMPAVHSPRSVDPDTLSHWLTTLDDAKSRMILAAVKTGAGGGAAEQVAATINIWWDSVPELVRNNIQFKLDAWHKEHPNVTPLQITKRKALLLLAAIRMEWRTRTPTLGRLTDSIARETVQS